MPHVQSIYRNSHLNFITRSLYAVKVKMLFENIPILKQVKFYAK